jgi:hypothetical protein
MQKPSQAYKWAMLPTPIHEWKVSGLPENIRLSIKRDDLTGIEVSGNKVCPLHSRRILLTLGVDQCWQPEKLSAGTEIGVPDGRRNAARV